MLAPSHENAAGLDDIVGQLDPFAVDDGVAVLLAEGLPPGFALGGQGLALFAAHPFPGLPLGLDEVQGGAKVHLIHA
jgi:hypothetical protein